MGDEMRLRQIVNNLASNACKFTLSGGEIRIVTRLVYPESLRGQVEEKEEVTEGEKVEERREEAGGGDEKDEVTREKEKERTGEGNTSANVIEREEEGQNTGIKELDFAFTRWAARKRRKSHANTNSKNPDHSHNLEKSAIGSNPQANPADTDLPSMPLSTAQLSRHNSVDELHNLENIVVRVEIHDTGFGIRAKDLVDNKLFSPYVQTEVSFAKSECRGLCTDGLHILSPHRSGSTRVARELGWALHWCGES